MGWGIGLGIGLGVLTVGLFLTGRSGASTAVHPWLNPQQPATRRADELLATLTLPQKERLAVGEGLPAVDVPGVIATDGPNGVRNVGLNGRPIGGTVTAFPAAENVAASWDRSLAGRFGAAVGAEAAARGANVLLGPTVNVVRSPRWGREAETLGEDPYLTGQLVAPEVRGIQSSHVVAEVKHYLGYDQETDRFGEPPGSAAVNDVVSTRALHEIYMPPFKAAVVAGGALGIMCSYNQINGQYACQDPATLDTLRRWGFAGIVGPDAVYSIRDPVAAFNAGTDLSFSSVTSLSAALAAGQITEQSVDDAARAWLTAVFGTGLFDHPNHGSSKKNASTVAHQALAATISESGSVLLKNAHGVLPLVHADKSIAVIGHAAVPKDNQVGEGGSPFVRPKAGSVVTPLAAIKAKAGPGVTVHFAQGTAGDAPLPVVPSDVLMPSSGSGSGLTGTYFANSNGEGAATATAVSPTIDFESAPAAAPSGPWSAVWTGTITPPTSGLYTFSIAPTGGTATLVVNGDQFVTAGASEGPLAQFGASPISFQGQITLSAGVPVPIRIEYSSAAGLTPGLHFGWLPPGTSTIPAAVAAARHSHVALVFVNSLTTEGTDRTTLTLPGNQDQLIDAVAAANPRTVVVVNSGGPVLMPWLSSVAGVIEAWYPGQADGTAIAALLFGDVDPSGRLPVTFPASDSQGPATQPAEFPGVDGNADYDEGIDVGYRYYEAHDQQPLFPFGFGLSYTSFRLGHLDVQRDGAGGDYMVSTEVTNTGRREGAEVVQLYVQDPSAATEPMQLKGFTKVSLAPGQTKTATVRLDRSSFATWDTAAGRWSVLLGAYAIRVGTSSESLPLRGSVTLKAMQFSDGA
jgi:beta-glucosidase